MGVEPTPPAWKAGVLPLNYTRTSRQREYQIRRVDSSAFIQQDPCADYEKRQAPPIEQPAVQVREA